MRVESIFTNDGIMIITYPFGIISETDIKTGITKLFQRGEFVVEWPDLLESEFCKRQNLIVTKGQIVNDHKPKLKD